MPFANGHNCEFKQKPPLCCYSFIATKTKCLPFEQLPEIIITLLENIAARRCIQSHPSHCIQADAGRYRPASVTVHARCTNQNLICKHILIYKYVCFYGHFVPNMQTHLLRLLLPDTLCRFANPALFVGEIRTSRPRPPGFCLLKRRAALRGGETQVFSSVIVGN